jgi:hypothetical protein
MASVLSTLKTSAWLLPLFQRLRGKTRGRFCTPEADLCIEGFESSANTYVFEVFRRLQDGLVIAHHTHSVANVKRALHWGVPVLILYRAPAEAIPSLVTRFRPRLPEALLNYIRFYEYVGSIRKRVILASFEEVTQDTETTIARVEQHTSLVFGPYDLARIDQDAREFIRAFAREHGTATSVSLPTEKRNQLKAEVREALVHMRLYPRAVRAYEALARAPSSAEPPRPGGTVAASAERPTATST